MKMHLNISFMKMRPYCPGQDELGACVLYVSSLLGYTLFFWFSRHIPDSKIHGANMGPIWGWQDPGGPHAGPMNFAIWDCLKFVFFKHFHSNTLTSYNYQGFPNTLNLPCVVVHF